MLLTAIAFIIVLGVLVFVHELGHFLAAKASGVKVLEFSLGFPPRIYSKKKGETTYSIGSLPLGGYVKMLGEEEVSSDPKAFNNQTPGKRLAISVAGVLMNFLLAWIILTALFIKGTTPIATPSESIPGNKVKSQIYIIDVAKDSPADKAGLKMGDILISGKNGGEAVSFNSVEGVQKFSSDNSGKTINIVVKRENSTLEKPVQVSENKNAPMGISIYDQSVVRVAWYKAPIVALRETYEILRITFNFLGDAVKNIFTKGEVSDQVGGPVAIFKVSGTAARAGAMAFFQLLAMLSINLGLINILPFPALDGGRALFVILEKIFRKKVIKEEIENIIHTVGFAILIILIILVTYNDILRLFKK